MLIGTEFAKAFGYTNEIEGLDKDGFLLSTKGDKLFVTGCRARSTLYAAYAFLESLGVHWVMPGAFGEIYPDKRTIVTTLNMIENPDHSQRYWWNT